jgi:hypothetical protein
LVTISCKHLCMTFPKWLAGEYGSKGAEQELARTTL